MNQEKKLMSLLQYMKKHDKGSTLFTIEDLSIHLNLNKNETFNVLKEAKKLRYIAY